ncbi:putative 6-phosphogluconolactonase [Diplonema papillatum]|nr:putative 6-phosphogluconolactonase [Diplonema papillatum]|eukprot:gene17535-26983_t
MTVQNVGTKDAMGGALAKVVEESMRDLKEGENFTVALSGGSLPAVLEAGLSAKGDMQWGRWHVFFADERLVPLDHADSNYLACKKALFSKVPIPEANIHAVKTDLDREAAAKDYAEQVDQVVGSAGFSLLLLGMGPDGHTLSLFPKHALLGEAGVSVASLEDSPKPPPARVTLTLPVCAQARRVCFVCAGAEKAEPLRRAVKPQAGEDPRDTPARVVAEAARAVTWIVDDSAAAKL